MKEVKEWAKSIVMVTMVLILGLGIIFPVVIKLCMFLWNYIGIIK